MPLFKSAQLPLYHKRGISVLQTHLLFNGISTLSYHYWYVVLAELLHQVNWLIMYLSILPYLHVHIYICHLC